MLPKVLFNLAAALYGLSALARIWLGRRKPQPVIQWISLLEKLTFVLFTGALVIYLYLISQGRQELMIDLVGYKKPLSWLLFSWCLNAASLLVEAAYGSQLVTVFASAWTSLALLLLPNTSPKQITSLFSNSLDWVHLHRMGFLLGYAFCLLALPLALQYLWQAARLPDPDHADRAAAERALQRSDRMQYRLLLWALPLLTVGIVVEAVYMLDNGTFPLPQELWNQRKEEFLALATWFLCGMYLHARLFFGWRYGRAAALYFTVMALLVAGHLSADFLHFSTAMR